MLVDQIDDHLAGRREEFISETIESDASHERVGAPPVGSDERLKPRWCRQAVIVGEGDEFPAGFRDTAVAGGRRAGIRLPNDAHRGPGRRGGLGRHDRLGAAVVHHDNLEHVSGKRLPGKRSQALAQSLWAGVGGDHDADEGGGHRGALFSNYTLPRVFD